MLSLDGCLARRDQLWSRIPETVEWLLIADPRHVYYLSNFLVNPLSFSAGERGLLLLEREAGATLVADNFTRRSAAGQPHVDRELIESWYDHKHSVINRDVALLNCVRALSERLYGRRGAVEAEWLPLGAWDLLGPDREIHVCRSGANPAPLDSNDSVDLGSLLRQLRRRKLPDEIALLKLAIVATEAGLSRAREVVRAGVTEWDVYRELHAAVLAAAGRPVCIYGDFRATNAETPRRGGAPTDYRLQEGDLLILDYSVVIDGYRSDFTNTLSVGPPTDSVYLMFDLCQSAMQAGEQTLRAGVRGRDVYDAVARPLQQSGYGLGFPHHAGHGIGLSHPEPPILVPESEDVLESGDVVTLEPGLYIPGIGGIRIEHNYFVTDTGCDRLSNHLISLT